MSELSAGVMLLHSSLTSAVLSLLLATLFKRAKTPAVSDCAARHVLPTCETHREQVAT